MIPIEIQKNKMEIINETKEENEKKGNDITNIEKNIIFQKIKEKIQENKNINEKNKEMDQQDKIIVIREKKEEEEYNIIKKMNISENKKRKIQTNKIKIITNINKLINKKTIEYMFKTKNIYGSILYLKNY